MLSVLLKSFFRILSQNAPECSAFVKGCAPLMRPDGRGPAICLSRFIRHGRPPPRAAYTTRLNGAGHAARPDSGIDPGCTTHISVIDAAGNAVSLTNTLRSRFGSKVISLRTGLLLNNGMMRFDPRPGQPNSIAPGAQPPANMCPVLAELPDGALLVPAAGGASS